MIYPDVGQCKMVRLKSLERAHAKLGRPYDPFDFVELSRKNLQHELKKLALEINQQNKKIKRAGGIKNAY